MRNQMYSKRGKRSVSLLLALTVPALFAPVAVFADAGTLRTNLGNWKTSGVAAAVVSSAGVKLTALNGDGFCVSESNRFGNNLVFETDITIPDDAPAVSAYGLVFNAQNAGSAEYIWRYGNDPNRVWRDDPELALRADIKYNNKNTRSAFSPLCGNM